ncbi:hypothetical protein QJQ45_015380 [Haematococcus lacustris]|nr:hypothetical protein QJQ45_015380 [Haematococcus lacustris]
MLQRVELSRATPHGRPSRPAALCRPSSSFCVRKALFCACSANQSTAARPAVFPASYEQAVRQAQQSVQAAIADGCKLIEVEFPTAGLASVSGDGEGVNEMNASMRYLRAFLSAFKDSAAAVRIFWPDSQELDVAVTGQTGDPGAGRIAMDPPFAGTAFKMGFLTKQNALWSAIGLNLGLGDKFSPVQQVSESDQVFVVAYPHFNPREEYGAVAELHAKVAGPRQLPLIVFNGDLDRLRGGYYPALFFGELARLTEELVPLFTPAYYIHNFKGRTPGVLFRAYPGPWCVFRRDLKDPSQLQLIWTSDAQPSLKQVAERVGWGCVQGAPMPGPTILMRVMQQCTEPMLPVTGA